MDDTLTFQSKLGEALEKRREWIDRERMSQLKDEFRVFQSSFTGLYKVLLKKGILHEDPYKHEEKIGEIQTPPESPFVESEKIEQMSIRLSKFESQLDFLVNYYQFSVDFLSMERIKRIVGLTKYFAWTQLNSSSQNTNTRALSDLIGLVKGGNDPLSIGLVADALQHLEKSTKDTLLLLKEIADFHRENYKSELRYRVMGSLKFDPSTVIARKDETLRQVKRKFVEAMADRPFYPELIEETLREDYSGEGEKLRDEVLKKLAVVEDKPKQQKREISFKAILMEALRILAALNFTLDDAQRKLQENSDTLESAKNGFWDKLGRLVRPMMNRPPEEIIYEVDFMDSATGVEKPGELKFTAFIQGVERKAKTLAAINNRTSSGYKRLESATEEQLQETLSKNIEELQTIHKSMSALDLFFKSEAPREERDRMRGIKPELTAIKNGIVKANQKRHEYIAQKEELEQMKRLGIRSEDV